MKSKLIFAVLALLVLVGLFVVLSPKKDVARSVELSTPELQTQPVVQVNVFELQISQGKLVSQEKTISVTEGENVTLKITSDQHDELHLHGYDQTLVLSPNEQATLQLNANLAGRFPIELHNSQTEIGALEVLPK